MARITIGSTGIVDGVSDDGRITYSSTQGGPAIDGRRAWRKMYLKPTDWTADDNDPVSDADWSAACELMTAVSEAHDAHSAELRDQAIAHANEIYAAREAGAEAAARGRGSHYDPNVQRSN